MEAQAPRNQLLDGPAKGVSMKCNYCPNIVIVGTPTCMVVQGFAKDDGKGGLTVQRRIVCADCIVLQLDLVLSKPKVRPAR